MHDVVEDTEITISDIEKMFNPKIAQIVEGLTKIPRIKRPRNFVTSRKLQKNAFNTS